MNGRHKCLLLSIALLAIVVIQVPALCCIEGEERSIFIKNNVQASQLQSEDVELLVAVPQNIDVNEPIYVMVAGIRNAKAVYVKPASLRFELMSNINDVTTLIVSDHYAYYDNDGNWVKTSGQIVDKINDNIYFTVFNAFGYDASLSVRVTMEWMAPWHEKITSSKKVDFTVGNWFNISAVIAQSSQKIRSSVLSKVDLGINLAMGLLTDVKAGVELFQEFFDQLDVLINTASVDPSNLNFYIIDLIGTSSNKGPMWEVAVNDLYSGTDVALREGKMDLRQAYIMQQIQNSFGILDAKIGSDTDASDNEYDYTITFVEDIYEWRAANSAYLMNPVAPRSDTWDTQFVNAGSKYGNETGGSWAQHKRCSLEFLLEPITGAHPDFKSPLGADHNTKSPRKSVIMNTMGPYFPVMNSWYDFYETDPTDRQYMTKDYDELTIQSQGYGTYKVYDDTDISKNYNRNVLKYDTSAPDGGTARSATYTDMFDLRVKDDYYRTSNFPMLNYSNYIFKLAQGMSDSFYYWINLGGGEPFSKMTKDINIGTTDLISNGVHDDFIELGGKHCNSSLLNFATGSFTKTTFDIYNYGNLSMFQLLDVFAKITAARISFSINAKPIGPAHTEYYKIETGRWVDAFFNGTDISELYGALADDNYITAKEQTALPWYSPKAKCHSFMYEDTWAYYRLGGLTDYQVPNEYSWIPFVGPNKQVPIGWMTSANLWYSVVGTYDIQMALDYLYGGIYMGYKEAVLNYKNVGIMAIIGAMQGTSVPLSELQYVQSLVESLDQAWYDLDLRLIDQIGSSIINAISKPQANGKNMPQQVFDKLVNRTAMAYAILTTGESDLGYVDEGLSKSGSDLALGDVGKALTDLINGAIGPALDLCKNLMDQVLSFIKSVKGNNFSTAIALDNAIMTSLESGWRGLTDFVTGIADRTEEGFNTVGNTISNVANAVNDTITSATNKVVSWTSDQIQKFGTETASRFNQIGTFINDQVFDGLQTVTDAVRSGSQFLLDGMNATMGWIETAINTTGQFVGDLAQQAGKAIGGVAGAAIGGAVLGPVGLIGGYFVGNAVGDNMGNGWKDRICSGFGAVSTAIDGVREDLYGVGNTLINDGYNLMSGAIQTGRTVGQQVINATSAALGVITNRSVGFVNSIGSTINGLSSFGNDMFQSMSGNVKSFGSQIKEGINTAWGAASQLANETLSWTKTQLTQVMEQNMATARSVMRGVKGNIVNVFNIVNLITLVMEQVAGVLQTLVDQVNVAFQNVETLFNQTTQFLVDLAGTGIDLAIDFAGNIATQLQQVETSIQQSTGFYTVMNTLYGEIRKSRTTAALLEYAQQTMGMTKELFFKWTDVFQPLSNAKGGDSGFRIYQMGSAFSNRLYLILTYMGAPVNVDTVVAKASRMAMGDETVPGNILEADIPVYELFEDGDRVDGVYYVSFNTTQSYSWYGDRSIEPDPIKIESARPATYLLRTDANYTTPVGSPHDGKKVTNTWMEKTELYSAQYTSDAFPVMELLSTYSSPITPGSEQSLRLSILNEMHSKPLVTFKVSMSTNTGFVVSSRDIADIRMPSDEEGLVLYEFKWTPSTSAPAGEFDLLVTVTEQNGDTTTKIIPVTIEATSWINSVLGWILGLFGSLLGGLGLGAFIVKKRRPSAGFAGLSSRSLDIPIPSSCTLDDMKNGTCTIDKLDLECDASTGKCKIKL